MWPDSRSAKKARMWRWLGGLSRWGGPSLPEGMLTSGKEMSLMGWKLSEVLALQSTRMKSL